MAYLRWGSDSDWYVFWADTRAVAKAEERLVVWHADVRDESFTTTYPEIRAMLQTGDFTAIPGYSERYRVTITQALAAFVEDVDLDYERNGRA